MLSRISIIIFLVLPCLAFAQQTPFSFRKLGLNEGLSQSSVVDIATDSTGFIWFATQDGLNRYDGREITVFRKTFDDVTTAQGSRLGKIICGEGNSMWLISSGGRLEQFDLTTAQFRPVYKIGRESTLLPLVNCIALDKGILLLGTPHGIYLYDYKANRVQHITADDKSAVPLNSNNIQGIYVDDKHQYWLLTDNGVNEINSSGEVVRSFLCTLNRDRKKWISCSAITQDNHGNYWMGTYGKGIYYKGKNDDHFIQVLHTGKQAIPLNTVTEAILSDKEGNVWFGTYGNGLYVLQAARVSLHHYLTDHKNPLSLSYNDILSIKEDNAGGIWIGTDGGGVDHYDKRFNNFGLLNKNKVPDNVAIEQVRSITTDSLGGLWIGTSNDGLTYANAARDSFATFHFPPYRANLSNFDRVVSLLCDRTGKLWIGTQGNGLLLLDPRTKKIKKRFYPGAPAAAEIPDQTIWCMLPCNDTQVLIGTRDAGLCLLDEKRGVIRQWDTVQPNGQRLPENNVRCLAQINDSTLCIGFDKEGIRLLHLNTFEISAPAVPFKKLAGEAAILKTITYKAPYLWIGTLGRGLIAWNTINNKTYLITEEQGLPNNTIYSILPAYNGTMWMSTNNGLCSFVPPPNLQHTSASNFNRYTAAEGLQSNEFNTGAYHIAADSVFYVGGISGLSFFKPTNMVIAAALSNVTITHIQVNNQPLQSDTADVYKKTLQLRYSQNALSFSFAALNFVSQDRVHYYYRLLNYNNKWIDAGNRNYAAYTNLPPGSYTLQVKALNNEENSNAPVTQLRIFITPPFWRTWWFVVVCSFAVTGLLYALYRYRVSQLLQLEQTRNRIASDLHDDIGSTLTNISLLAELSRKKLLPGNEEAAVFLKRISEEVQQFSQALDDIVWSINSKNDTLEQTAARMRRYAGEIFEGADIRYTLVMDEAFANQKLNMEQRRDCFLMYKEVINNIYKHAHATEVSIHISLDKNELSILIKDNGKGFNTNGNTHRNGLNNLRLRAEKWHGTVQVQSAVAKGTTIHISIWV